jgi:hypothetical protein
MDETRTLVSQTILWACNQPIQNEHFAFSKLTDAIIKMNDLLLDQHLPIPVNHMIQLVINDVFSDQVVNWGRIVAVFSLCATMANHYKDKPDILGKLEEHFTTAIFNRVGYWIDNHNGWQGFKTFMNRIERKNRFPGLNFLFWFLVIVPVTIFLLYKY